MTLPMTGKNCSLALKWLISFAIPLIVYWAMPIDGQTVTHHMALFLSITTWAICIWAMDAMNEIAVGLILPVLYIVLCGVKQQVVYSPWLSEVPLIVIGGFALGKILQETGLGKRIGLTCVRCMGGSFTGTLIGITLAVSIVAPLVPAITGKAAIFCAIFGMIQNPAGIKGTILSLALIIVIVGVSYFYSAGHTVNIVDLQNNGFFGHGETVITETSILVTYVACVAAFVTAVATEIWGAFK